MSERRVVLAFLVTPLIIPFIVFLMLFWQFRSDTRAGLSAVGALVVLVTISIWAVPTAYVAEAVLGLPAWKLFEYYKVRSALAFGVLGAILGLVVFVVIGLVNIVNNFPNESIDPLKPFSNFYFSLCMLGGSASALVFRAIVFSGPATSYTTRPNQE